MSERILEVTGLTKRFGGFVALDKVSLHLDEGERLGLIGPNGSGKTTMINCISGALINDEGRVQFKGADITGLKAHKRAQLGIARSFQVPKPFGSMTVLENLCIPLEFAARGRTDPGAVEDQAMEILKMIGFEDRARENSAGLTQVDMRKLELARALAAKPALLVSDEAMAGLSASEVDDILEILFKLNATGVAVIMIEHIMRAVMRYSQRIIVLDAGQKIAEGTPDEVIHDPQVERAYLGE
ncbi:MAG: ABC transporter ATP-binding protein [Rhodospirillaceae bacterium]|jgi:branched-chain amino acid transport system ATP-binding protein|nr:ABC transporter ATP-binding protein [Rhodospirillaceae bacterium]MBT3887293.1 ABC transporter ATP-binding protein [Rhodospirillaceae bacterium]MBT4118520.1 ABC transporter ATP-binding protein [Rhodospirillaceae bacterium]MBT4671982.1 ABC transporter ATP-binding protein [Rhodospirillaceae bacterium]MBT4720676.1 ABC transporter ATP-binding protein [Rhodospirillaceae bacterium]